jgi:hypothetical protein
MWCSVDVSSNDDSALKKMTVIVGLHLEDNMTCHSVLEICRVHTVDQVLDQRLTMSGEELEEE